MVNDPNPVDVHVGRRLKMRRMMIGMSQEKLGNELGLTFQQIQKYEKGVNRIGASRLYDIARALGVSVQYFFEDLPETGPSRSFDLSGRDAVMECLNSAEGLALITHFAQIRDAATRRRIVELVRTLGAEPAAEGGGERS
ncbi:MAG: XRE family transcriptional regulator [Alphaproteobacteria bacterium]|nr:MAG: XRE family transcriptional regulator [Alphaproteobacteria bacterium]